MPPASNLNAPIVTGLGCVSALGDDVESFWSGLLAGKSGIKPIEEFSCSGLRTPLAGVVRSRPG